GESLAAIIELTNQGLVTSGNYRKFYIEDGIKRSHTIDPATGYPVKHNLLSATVIAANSTIADAYATYLMVIGFEEAKSFLEKNPHFDAILVYGDQDKMKVYSTKGVKLAE
ncbi:MAG: FAD:protein FMN transferase, partial [Bacteroidales bacterium]|nr:FAD:protein FMN transferase [Bacteroidales bacterium]